jgi:hypothetical protein
MKMVLNSNYDMIFVIPYPRNDHEKFVVYGKKYEVVWVIMTYISREI